jgi:hypothetical protein
LGWVFISATTNIFMTETHITVTNIPNEQVLRFYLITGIQVTFANTHKCLPRSVRSHIYERNSIKSDNNYFDYHHYLQDVSNPRALGFSLRHMQKHTKTQTKIRTSITLQIPSANSATIAVIVLFRRISEKRMVKSQVCLIDYWYIRLLSLSLHSTRTLCWSSTNGINVKTIHNWIYIRE